MTTNIQLVVGLASALVSAWAHAQDVATLEAGAVGVFWLKNGGDQIEVAFPAVQVHWPDHAETMSGEDRAKIRIVVAGAISLYDSEGRLTQVTAPKKFTSKFWCDNDGGEQYRPSFTLTLPVDPARRALKPIRALQGLAGIAVVGEVGRIPKLDATSDPKQRRLTVTFEKESQRSVQISARPDPANNCDGLPKNNLSYELEVGAASYPLRCCGP